MQILVSRGILKLLRKTLADLLPDSRPSHRAEAIAFGTGFATHAALIDWMDNSPFPVIRAREFSPALTNDRLSQLTGRDVDGVAAIKACVRGARVEIVHPDFWTLRATAEKKILAHESDVSYWKSSSLSGSEKLALACGLLISTMERTGCVDDFVDRYSRAGNLLVGSGEMTELLLHVRLAACFERHRDYDPDIADFLADWLRDADVEGGGRWGARIWSTFLPRIETFIDAVCRTWDENVDPSTVRSNPEKRIAPRESLVSYAKAAPSPERGPFVSLWDAGMTLPSRQSIAGLVAFAMWKTHRTFQGITYFTQNIAKHPYFTSEITRTLPLVDKDGRTLSSEEIEVILRQSSNPLPKPDSTPPTGAVNNVRGIDILGCERKTARQTVKTLRGRGCIFVVLDDDVGVEPSEVANWTKHAVANADADVLWIDDYTKKIDIEAVAKALPKGVAVIVNGVNAEHILDLEEPNSTLSI